MEAEHEDFKFPDEKKDDEKVVAQELEIEIEDDTPPEDRGRKSAPPPEEPSDEELSTYDEKVQSRIKKFTRGYHDERRAKESALREREAAENFARQVFEENKRLKLQIESGSKVIIEQTKTSATTDLESAKKRLKEAFEAGDSDALVEAQEAISKATLKLDKAANMQPIVAPEEEFKNAEPESTTKALPPKTKQWVNSNKDWFGVDEEMTMAAMGIDKKLQREYGSDYVGTDEYFKKVDQTMRKRFPEYFETQSHEDDDTPPKKVSEPADEDEPPRRASKSATVVAPASRSTPPTRVKLKTSEANLARRLGVPLEVYAKEVAKLGRNQ
jgi:hypothetical protein